MTTAKRRLTDIKFEHEGAHVALVGKHQGGPANGITTLVFKATDHIDPTEVALAVAGQSPDQPLTIIGEPLVETIEKSVVEQMVESAKVEATALIQKALDTQVELVKAKDLELEAFRVEAAGRKEAVRKAALSAVAPADQIESLMKSLAPLADEAFDGVVASFAVTKALADQSDMLQETGVNGTGVETAQEVDMTTAILKAKYGPKAI